MNDETAPEEPRCAAHELGLSWHAAGFRGLASRRWRATRDVSASALRHAGEVGDAEPARITIGAGTRLRLDQTDATQQGCTPADFIVSQQFHVLDGAHAGRCGEFTRMVPDAYTA